MGATVAIVKPAPLEGGNVGYPRARERVWMNRLASTAWR